MTHSPPPAMPGRSHAPPPTSGVPGLRDRSRALATTMGRRDQQSQPQTVRELVQVIDAGTGNFPTQPDQVAIANPVEIDADDVEGATPTFTPDASQPIPVVFVRSAPKVGDYAVAHAIAGRWVAEVGGGKATFCVLDCNIQPIAGAVVTAKDGSGKVVATCTAGANGCCSLPVTGTYTVEAATPIGTVARSNLTVQAGQTYILAAGCCVKVCVALCAGAAPPAGCPTTVTIKDGKGDTVFAGQTDASGCVTPTMPLPEAGPFTAYLTNLPPGYTADPAGYPIACDAVTATLNVPGPSDHVCCNPPILIRRSLTLTDANGGHPFDACTDANGNGSWSCCYTIAKSPAMDQACSAYDQTSPVAIYYSGSCGLDPADGVMKFSIARSWQSVSASTANGVKNNYMWTQCGTLNGCPALFPRCSSTADRSAGYFPMDPCQPFAVSGTLTPDVANIMPDPVGGTVAIS